MVFFWLSKILWFALLVIKHGGAHKLPIWVLTPKTHAGDLQAVNTRLFLTKT